MTKVLANSILESQATAFYEDSHKGGRVLKSIGKGLLILRDDDTIWFYNKKRLGGYAQESDHWYTLSSIRDYKGRSDGFDAEVYFEATKDDPSQIVNFSYQLTEEDAVRWEHALSKITSASSGEETTQVPVKEKETIIKEVIVKVRCSHCGNLYDERGDKCPNCGGR